MQQLGRLGGGQDWRKKGVVRECDSQTQEAGEQGLQLLSWHCHGSSSSAALTLTLTHIMAKDTHSAPQVFFVQLTTVVVHRGRGGGGTIVRASVALGTAPPARQALITQH